MCDSRRVLYTATFDVEPVKTRHFYRITPLAEGQVVSRKSRSFGIVGADFDKMPKCGTQQLDWKPENSLDGICLCTPAVDN